MASIINTNISALNAHKNLTVNDSRLSKSLERLSSGLRINRAADDAAGLSISEKMRGQVGGLKQAVRNAQDGISLVQTAEGALNEIHSTLQRIRELSVQAANDTLQTADRASIQNEISDLTSEIDRITGSTKFNDFQLLGGLFENTSTATGNVSITVTGLSATVQGATYTITSGAGTVTVTDAADPLRTQVINAVVAPAAGETTELNFSSLGIKLTIDENWDPLDAGATTVVNNTAKLHVGANQQAINAAQTETISVQIGSMASSSIGSASGSMISDVAVLTQQGAEDAIKIVDDAIEDVSTLRSNLGAVQNRLDHTISNLSVSVENITASESRIRDLDFAAEMVNFTRNQIMLQAGTAMLAQANAAPQSVLSLLRG